MALVDLEEAIEIARRKAAGELTHEEAVAELERRANEAREALEQPDEDVPEFEWMEDDSAPTD